MTIMTMMMITVRVGNDTVPVADVRAASNAVYS